jgi:guanosine-3',5'-bis(diphosphate) 3'-pyrophosphohydrolase
MMNHNDMDVVSRAISYAARAHRSQLRKDGETPYVAHPFRVFTIVSCAFGVRDPEVLATAVLHDTIEDTTVDRDDLIEHFGPRVAHYVALLSKDKRQPEAERERIYFEALAAAPVEVQLCKLADTCDNLLDSEQLPTAGRAKALAKAQNLLGILEPNFPAQWTHALDYLREQISRRTLDS